MNSEKNGERDGGWLEMILYGTDRSSGYSEKQGEKKGRTVLRGDEGMEEVNASK